MTNKEKVLHLIREAGILRPRDLLPYGIPRTTLSRLEHEGRVRRIARGLYELADSDPTEHIDLIEVCKRVPRGIVCLISALTFHELTTQMPYEVWVAIDVKAYKPKIERPPVRFVRFSGDALTFGVEEHEIQGAQIRVTSPPKTVADCFKYRNKIGLDVAVEALREFIRNRRGSMEDLWRAAAVCRVQKIMRPYIEAIQ
jgi:predicted transcriptional regulator of viral defense system